MSAMTGSAGGLRSATVSDSADLSCGRESNPSVPALNETLPSQCNGDGMNLALQVGQANDCVVITENELQKQIILLQQTVSKWRAADNVPSVGCGGRWIRCRLLITTLHEVSHLCTCRVFCTDRSRRKCADELPVGVLEDALYSGRQIVRAGVEKLVYASRAARNGSLDALQGQYQRLSQSAPPPRTPKTVEAEVIELSSRGSSPRRPPPPRALLPPPRSKTRAPPPPRRSSSKMRTAEDFFCRYSIDLQRSSKMPLARSFDPGRESRCPACKIRIPVDSDDMWDVDFPIKGKLPPAPAHPRAPSPGLEASSKGPPDNKAKQPPESTDASRGRSRTGKEVVAVTEQSGKKLTFRIPARFLVKCHTPRGEYACGLCAGPRGDSAVVVLCETPEDLVYHIAKEHKTADIEKDVDIIADS